MSIGMWSSGDYAANRNIARNRGRSRSAANERERVQPVDPKQATAAARHGQFVDKTA